MYIDDFVWLSSISDKLIIKHNITEEEVEETSTEESTELEDIPTDTNDDGQITLSLD